MSELAYLAHHGVKGQRRGVRQYQNPDGSLTALGRIHYGVGEARKKASAAASTVGRVVKKTMRDLRDDRRARAEISKKNKAEKKARREEADQQRRASEIEKLQKRLIKTQQKKTLAELEKEYGDARLEKARRKVEALAARQQRFRDMADLKAQEKYLKRTMKEAEKRAKRDATKKYKRQDIKLMTDKEIDDRIARLRKEATLRTLEVERATPAAVSTGAKLVGKWTTDVANSAVSGFAGSVRVAVGAKTVDALKKADISQADIDEFIKWTKKK